MKTGYFANEKSWTKVHIVDGNNHPICGAVIGKDKWFQWCSPRIKLDYLECEHCKKHPIVKQKAALELEAMRYLKSRTDFLKQFK